MRATRTDPASLIRQTLKTLHGWTPRQVSVVTDGNAIRCTIKAPGISRAAVKAIAAKHEVVRRCEVTQEILCGGNTFVSVNMDLHLISTVWGQIQEWVKHRMRLDGTMYLIPATEMRVCCLGEQDFLIDPGGDELDVRCWGSGGFAETLAMMLTERGITDFQTPDGRPRDAES